MGALGWIIILPVIGLIGYAFGPWPLGIGMLLLILEPAYTGFRRSLK